MKKEEKLSSHPNGKGTRIELAEHNGRRRTMLSFNELDLEIALGLWFYFVVVAFNVDEV